MKTQSTLALLLSATLAMGTLTACDQKSAQDQQIADLSKKAEEAQAALAQAQAEKQALEDKANADKAAADKAEAEAKLKEAEAKAAAAEKEAAAAKRRAAAAERRHSQSSAAVADNVSRPAPVESKPICAHCGTVTAITPVTVEGQGTGMGAVGGAVAGAVIGHQIGRGTGNKVAEAIGAIAGGFGGNAVEKRVRSTTVYDVTVRMDAGGSRTVRVGDAAGLSSGERVRVDGANLQRL